MKILNATVVYQKNRIPQTVSGGNQICGAISSKSRLATDVQLISYFAPFDRFS